MNPFHYHASTRKEADQSDTNVEDADYSGGGGGTDGKKEEEEEGVTEEQEDDAEVRDDSIKTNNKKVTRNRERIALGVGIGSSNVIYYVEYFLILCRHLFQKGVTQFLEILEDVHSDVWSIFGPF